jgi:hypothetical protein
MSRNQVPALYERFGHIGRIRQDQRLASEDPSPSFGWNPYSKLEFALWFEGDPIRSYRLFANEGSLALLARAFRAIASRKVEPCCVGCYWHNLV